MHETSSPEAGSNTRLTDLPLDVLLLIAPYLTARDFLVLTGTCRRFYDDHDLRFSSSFWSRLARRTFRVPNQPVVEADGHRWMGLYRRMHTQSRVFNWGNNDGFCFGSTVMRQDRRPPRPMRSIVFTPRISLEARLTHVCWPHLCPMEEVGIVADLQCGGWSTVMLNSRGCLYINGKVSGLAGNGQLASSGPPKLLSYPPHFPDPSKHEDARTTIEQFSVGRSHVLGLSDSGHLWTWSDAHKPAVNLGFQAVETHERSSSGSDQGPRGAHGLITKVVAGFSRSSAYVHGKGILLWEPVDNAAAVGSGAQEGSNSRTAVEAQLVPDTGFVRPTRLQRSDDSELGSRVGQVRSWVLLGDYLLFVTDLDKIFSVRLESDGQFMSQPVELKTRPDEPEQPLVADVQGSHIHFAVLLRDGQVFTGDQDALSQMRADQSTGGLRRIPSLQHTGVISMAFGDYHFLALHADGNITAHGKEPQQRGALGLGDFHLYALRGICETGRHPPMDCHVMPECETTGRRVFFDQSKYHWLRNLDGGQYDSEGRARYNAVLGQDSYAPIASEWVEQKLRDWDSMVGGECDREQGDGTKTYFATSVAAGGWHSAAIVLVNDDKNKEEARAKLSAQRSPRAFYQGQHPDDGDGDDDGDDDDDDDSDNSSGTPHAHYSGPPRRPSEPCYNCIISGDFCKWAGSTCKPCAPTPNGASSLACIYPREKAWWYQTLPRLRMRDGNVLPGSEPESDWTCPEFVSWN